MFHLTKAPPNQKLKRLLLVAEYNFVEKPQNMHHWEKTFECVRIVNTYTIEEGRIVWGPLKFRAL